jgi:hypothetical protein
MTAEAPRLRSAWSAQAVLDPRGTWPRAELDHPAARRRHARYCDRRRARRGAPTPLEGDARMTAKQRDRCGPRQASAPSRRSSRPCVSSRGGGDDSTAPRGTEPAPRSSMHGRVGRFVGSSVRRAPAACVHAVHRPRNALTCGARRAPKRCARRGAAPGGRPVDDTAAEAPSRSSRSSARPSAAADGAGTRARVTECSIERERGIGNQHAVERIALVEREGADMLGAGCARWRCGRDVTDGRLTETSHGQARR